MEGGEELKPGLAEPWRFPSTMNVPLPRREMTMRIACSARRPASISPQYSSYCAGRSRDILKDRRGHYALLGRADWLDGLHLVGGLDSVGGARTRCFGRAAAVGEDAVRYDSITSSGSVLTAIPRTSPTPARARH